MHAETSAAPFSANTQKAMMRRQGSHRINVVWRCHGEMAGARYGMAVALLCQLLSHRLSDLRCCEFTLILLISALTLAKAE